MMKQLKIATAAGALAMIGVMTPATAASTFPSSSSETPAFFFNMEMMKRMDRNKDGAVSRDEYLQYLGRQFDRMDVEKKGRLTARQFTDQHLMAQSFIDD